MRIMGTPDARQIDGIGGAHPLTSKVAVVWPSDDDDVDVEYLFLQVGVDQPIVTDRQNCGNLLAGVGPFAIERGLDRGRRRRGRRADPHDQHRQRRRSPRSRSAGGMPVYAGDTAIAGVPGTAATIRLDFADIAGGSCGALLPTGHAVDTIARHRGDADRQRDAGRRAARRRSRRHRLRGTAPSWRPTQQLRSRLEDIRLQAGQLMNLGDVTVDHRPQAHARRPAARRRIDQHPDVHPPPLSTTRSACSARCRWRRRHCSRTRRPTACSRAGADAAGRRASTRPARSTPRSTSRSRADGTPEVGRAGIIRTARKLMDGIVFPRDY